MPQQKITLQVKTDIRFLLLTYKLPRGPAPHLEKLRAPDPSRSRQAQLKAEHPVPL